jgi:DNA-binding NarL/FixJ family response regulator
MIRVLVADDHSMVREGLRALIEGVRGYEFVGAVGTGKDAVREAVLLRPSVVVMDIGMPGGSGIEAAREIARLAPDVRVLVLTMFDDDDSVFAAMRAGALGYVLKGADPDDIIRAIDTVAANNAIFGPGLAQRLISYLSAPRSSDLALPSLTPREREVLDLIASGLGNATIAARLGISPNTIANHTSNIFAKLQVTSRAEAIVQARSAGLGMPHEAKRAHRTATPDCAP